MNGCISWNRGLFEAGCEEMPMVGRGQLASDCGLWSKRTTDPTPQFLHDRC